MWSGGTKTASSLFLIVLTLNLNAFSQAGYGDPVEGYADYPQWYERAALTLTNSCRLAPAEYRDRYLGEYEILLPQNYPAVGPVYWNIDLNRAARDHTVDMATNCRMLQHESCDGTQTGTRIRSYYDKGGGWGENIAYSQYRPQGTLRQWLMDADNDDIPAPDNQEPDNRWYSGDGHRSNIMASNWGELGVGFATGTSEGGNLRPFWTQDFGSGDNEYNDYAIPAGSHIYVNPDAGWGTDQFEADAVTFMAIYYTTPSTVPAAARVIINSTPYPLTLESGEPGRGTWTLALPKTGSCREYYFEFENSQAEIIKYPQDGILLSFGEGDCTSDYISEAQIRVAQGGEFNRNQLKASYFPGLRQISLSGWNKDHSDLADITITNLSGQKLPVHKLSDIKSGSVLLQLNTSPSRGIYLIQGSIFPDKKFSAKLYIY